MAHPSRDDPLQRGDVTASGQGVLLDQGEGPARARQVGFPHGQALSGGAGHDPETNSSRLRTASGGGFGNQLPTAYEALATVADSRIPTQDLARNRGDINLRIGGTGPKSAGHYQPATKFDDGPDLNAEVALASRSNTRDTVVHEIGHAQHYDKSTHHERTHPTADYTDTHNVRGGNAPDPLKEGVADGYVDRYGGPSSPTVQEAVAGRSLDAPNGAFGHMMSTGYGTQYEPNPYNNPAWGEGDRAVYAGTRAHFSETGDAATYQSRQNRNSVEKVSGRYDFGPGSQPGVNPVTDATIHHLSQSPHAQQAWKDTTSTPSPAHSRTLSDVASEASRRHKDRRLLNEGQFTQESLFNEMRTEPMGGKAFSGDTGKHLGYAPNPGAAAPGKMREAASEMGNFDRGDDVAWPHQMGKNQFGETPRTRTDIRSSLGVPKDVVSTYARPRAETNFASRVTGNPMQSASVRDRKDIR